MTAHNHKQLILQLKNIALMLGKNAEINEYTTSDSVGRSSKKIVIEYDIKQKTDD